MFNIEREKNNEVFDCNLNVRRNRLAKRSCKLPVTDIDGGKPHKIKKDRKVT